MTPRISLLAHFLGIEPTTFWRFVRRKGTSRLLRKNAVRVAEWLRLRGIEIEDPPKEEGS
jgi:hypothetical protein